MSLLISCVVKRTSLALSDLQLETTNYCKVVKFGPGIPAWEKTYVRSPFAHGAYPTAMKRSIVQMPLTVRLYATDASILGQRTDELFQAVSQFTFQMEFTYDSIATRRWQCYAADTFTIGDAGSFDKTFLHHHWQEIALDIPRQPVPLQGAV